MPGRKKSKNSINESPSVKKTDNAKNPSKKKTSPTKTNLVVNINRGLGEDGHFGKSTGFKPAMSKLEKPEEIKERLRMEKQQKKQERIQQKKKQKIKEHSSEIVREIERKLEKEEKEKKLVMWLGVSFFMVLIVSFWLITVKKTVVNSGKVSGEQSEWEAISQEFSEGMRKAEEDMEEVKDSAAMGVEMIKEGIGASTTEGEIIPREEQGASTSNLLGSDDVKAIQQKLEEVNSATSSTNTIN